MLHQKNTHSAPITKGSLTKIKREAKRLIKLNPERKLTDLQNEITKSMTGFASFKALLADLKEYKSIYTLQIANSAIGMYRFQQDNTWRAVSEMDTASRDDRIFNDAVSLNKAVRPNSEIIIEGHVFKADPSEYSFGDMHTVHRSIKTHLKNLPKKIPNIDQLKDAVALGDDSRHSYICLNDSGLFEVLHDEQIPYKSLEPRLVLVGETLIAHNGYIGKDASLDETWINRNFQTGVGAWLDYLETGRSQLSESRYENTNSIEILTKLEKLINSKLK